MVFRFTSGAKGLPLAWTFRISSSPLISGAPTITWRVKTAGTHQGGVQDIGTVGGGDHDDALVGAEAVHFHQQLVQGLLSLVARRLSRRRADGLPRRSHR